MFVGDTNGIAYSIQSTAHDFGVNIYYTGYDAKPTMIVGNICSFIPNFSVWYMSGQTGGLLNGNTAMLSFPIYGGNSAAVTGRAAVYIRDNGGYHTGDIVVTITNAAWHHLGTLRLNWRKTV